MRRRPVPKPDWFKLDLYWRQRDREAAGCAVFEGLPRWQFERPCCVGGLDAPAGRVRPGPYPIPSVAEFVDSGEDTWLPEGTGNRWVQPKPSLDQIDEWRRRAE